jgi:hypothetical protein
MFFYNIFGRMFFLVCFLATLEVSAEVLELGASELFGKKDQPEAMTFVARASIDDVVTKVYKENNSQKIKEDIKGRIFDFSFGN